MRNNSRLFCSVLCLCAVLLATGCGKRRHGGGSTETFPEETGATVTEPAPGPAAQAPAPEPKPVTERDPNAGLSGLARVRTEQETKNNLRQLGLAYMTYLDSNGRPPRAFKDLGLKDVGIEEAVNKGWIQVAWGTDLRRLPQGTTNTILAYERDPDGQGLRWAVMGDGQLERIAPEDFEKKKVKGK